MDKIMSVVGARPQFIKAAALNRVLENTGGISQILVHTGQHYSTYMSDVFFNEMLLSTPHYNLEVNQLSHGAMTGKMLSKLETVMQKEEPDIVVVYGDTNSTLAGALAAAKMKIPVAHVEAGMRSHRMDMPEEINRILTDRISTLLFCPTETSLQNLKKEGFADFDCKIIKCGDVMLDASLFYSERAKGKSEILKNLGKEKFVLCTIHRAENTDVVENLRAILDGLEKVNNEVPVIVPLHPRTRKLTQRHKLNVKVTVVEPVGYLEMIDLIKNSSLVMTDSGGLQKEAYIFGKHCVTLREETEWIELVENGFNLVVGTQPSKIYEGYVKMINRKSNFGIDLYGGGKASKRIVNEMLGFLSQ